MRGKTERESSSPSLTAFSQLPGFSCLLLFLEKSSNLSILLSLLLLHSCLVPFLHLRQEVIIFSQLTDSSFLFLFQMFLQFFRLRSLPIRIIIPPLDKAATSSTDIVSNYIINSFYVAKKELEE